MGITLSYSNCFTSVSEEQQEVVCDELKLAEEEGSGGETLEQPTAVGKCLVNNVEHERGLGELKKGEKDEAGSKEKEGAVGWPPKHGRFWTSKPDEGESCSVQHCA